MEKNKAPNKLGPKVDESLESRLMEVLAELHCI